MSEKVLFDEGEETTQTNSLYQSDHLQKREKRELQKQQIIKSRKDLYLGDDKEALKFKEIKNKIIELLKDDIYKKKMDKLKQKVDKNDIFKIN